MKKWFFWAFYFSVIPVFSFSTEASKYAEKQYNYKIKHQKVHINVKKEHISDYPLIIDGQNITAMRYGYGDMTGNNCKKTRISYIVLLDTNCKPLCSFIMPSKQ